MTQFIFFKFKTSSRQAIKYNGRLYTIPQSNKNIKVIIIDRTLKC